MTSSSSSGYTYDASFFDYVQAGAIRSAPAIVPIIVDALACRSVLDVGCGTGAWLSVYRDRGVADVMGVDSECVANERLLIPPRFFQAIDVSRPFDLGRRFDLVQSLEVAEHIHPDASQTIVANLTHHASRVLFSAAVPGQGGEHHINERPYEFWRELFAARGFVAFDFVRPSVRPEDHVDPWYAYNSILYVHRDSIGSLPDCIRKTRVPDGLPIANVASAVFRLRTALLRPLPVSIVSRLAVLNRRLTLARRSG